MKTLDKWGVHFEVNIMLRVLKVRLNRENRCIQRLNRLFTTNLKKIYKFNPFFIILNQKIPKRVKYLRLISCLENGGIAQLPVPLLLVFYKANP